MKVNETYDLLFWMDLAIQADNELLRSSDPPTKPCDAGTVGPCWFLGSFLFVCFLVFRGRVSQ